MHSIWGALGTLVICILATVAAAGIRADLPAWDGTEYIRQITLWQGYAAMSAIDAITIIAIRLQGKCYPRLTNPMTIVLALSIINHAYGAFSYAAYNTTGLEIYDIFVLVITLAQITVFSWWWISRNGRRDRRFSTRSASTDFRNSAGPLCNTKHKASPR